MQGEFDFGDKFRRKKRRDTLFFALFPDKDTALAVAEFAAAAARENGLGGRRIREDRLHMSLHFAGELRRRRSQMIHAARQAGRGVAMPPFEVLFRIARSFELPPLKHGRSRPHPFVLIGEGDGLHELHARLGAAMAACGLRTGEGFAPHMTLLYDSPVVPPRAVAPIRFLAREFALIHSEVGLTRYNIVGRWPLAA